MVPMVAYYGCYGCLLWLHGSLLWFIWLLTMVPMVAYYGSYGSLLWLHGCLLWFLWLLTMVAW